MSFATESDLVQEIANAATLALPIDIDWRSISMICELDPNDGTLEFENTFVDLGGASRALPWADSYIALFRDLAKTVAAGKPSPVTKVTLTIDESGDYRTTYGYGGTGLSS